MVRRALPSMFHRRLALLAGAASVGFGLLAAQAARLSLVSGDDLRDKAESKLTRLEWMPTTRGRILDRRGRVLAQDIPSFTLCVNYSILSGRWFDARAREIAGRFGRPDSYAAIRDLLEVHVWEALSRGCGIEQAELARRRDEIVERVTQQREATVRRQWRERVGAALAGGQVITADFEARLERDLGTLEIAEQKKDHAIARGLSDELGYELLRHADLTTTIDLSPALGPGASAEIPELPTVTLTPGGGREYPMDKIRVEVDRDRFPAPIRSIEPALVVVRGAFTHVLGWMRQGATAEDTQRRITDLDSRGASDPQGRGSYREGDSVGAAGIERAMESSLRGLRGLATTRRDTGERELLQAEPGSDVRLTIDADLTARIHALLAPEVGLCVAQSWHRAADQSPVLGEPVPGEPLRAAVAVVEIDSGDILALVSTPGFTHEDRVDRPEWVFGDPVDAPWVNRAIAKPYPPGSIVKPLMFCEAVRAGKIGVDGTIPCTGHLLPGQADRYRCWVFKRFGGTHNDVLGHDLRGAEAIMVSCNIFFYELGRRLGPEGIAEAYRRLHVGRPWNLGVGTEFAGEIGSGGGAREGSGEIGLGDCILMGMGQGPVAWTPLHAANAFATLARGGIAIDPRLRIGDPRREEDLGYEPRAVVEALEGLHASANDARGSGHHLTIDSAIPGEPPVVEPNFNVPGVEVWGKTGTAAAPDLLADPDGDGPLAPVLARRGDHAWFVLLAGERGNGPRFAVAVLVEYAGSGGRVAGPIANQVLWALVRCGYLTPSAS